MPAPSDPKAPQAAKGSRTKMVALGAAFLVIELVGIAGFVLASSANLDQLALFAVSGALVVVPILFAVALGSKVGK